MKIGPYISIMLSYKRTICAEAKNLVYEDKVEIIRLIKSYDSSKLKSAPNGTHIDLSKLPDSVIMEIYGFIKRKLSLP